MNQINRNMAIEELCKKKLFSLDSQNRESYIMDWWGIDEDDHEFFRLSTELQSEVLANDNPPKDSNLSKYDELILVALFSEFKGVTNAYLIESMVAMGLGTYEVSGVIEILEVCPCCMYRTLEFRDNYNICGLCNWEDNGVNDIKIYSGPNHMTLGEAQDKFTESMADLPLGKWVKA